MYRSGRAGRGSLSRPPRSRVCPCTLSQPWERAWQESARSAPSTRGSRTPFLSCRITTIRVGRAQTWKTNVGRNAFSEESTSFSLMACLMTITSELSQYQSGEPFAFGSMCFCLGSEGIPNDARSSSNISCSFPCSGRFLASIPAYFCQDIIQFYWTTTQSGGSRHYYSGFRILRAFIQHCGVPSTIRSAHNAKKATIRVCSRDHAISIALRDVKVDVGVLLLPFEVLALYETLDPLLYGHRLFRHVLHHGGPT